MSGTRRLFLPALRALDGRMRAPVPGRTRLLTEMEADLEELTRHLRAQGLAPDEARRRALDVLMPDDAVLQELERLHAAPFERLTRSIPDAHLRRIERWVFASAALAVLTSVVVVLGGVDLLRHASPFLWPVLAVGSALAAIAARAGFLVWLRLDTDGGARWTAATGAGAAALLLLGGIGAAIDLHDVAGRIAASPSDAVMLVVGALQQVGGLGVVTLVLSLVAGAVWYATRHRILVLVSRHARVVGALEHLETTETSS